ncbi:MAG: hypothetical protein GXP17_05985 [Gammaproteobacteria bacterium]|nr:hypothetical protein [Gammaproteobacteria bacterium]
MNKFLVRPVYILAALLVGFLLLNTAHAMGSKSAKTKQTTLQQTYVWHDGDRERTVWLNPQLVAEFDSNAKSQSALKAAYSSAVEVSAKRGSIRLWRLNNNVKAKTAIRGLKSNSMTGKFSPVLHDGPSSSGRMRSLPGNIIVHLDPSWEQDLIDGWLIQNNLEIVRKLNIGPNIFVIKTESGLAALEMANSLHDAGEVVAAYPDWWKEVVTR